MSEKNKGTDLKKSHDVSKQKIEYRGKKEDIKYCNEEIIQKVADDLNIHSSIVKDVVIEGQSKFTVAIIQNNSFEGIRWPYFGTFKVKPKSVQLIRHLKGLDANFKKLFLQKIKINGLLYGERKNKK